MRDDDQFWRIPGPQKGGDEAGPRLHREKFFPDRPAPEACEWISRSSMDLPSGYSGILKQAVFRSSKLGWRHTSTAQCFNEDVDMEKKQERILLEICVDSVESAVAAQAGGAHRVELCADLLEGGITPSLGMMRAVRERISIPLHVMIRPRGGDFSYSDEELEVVRDDIAFAKNVGVDGVVLGIFDNSGTIDVERTSRLVELSRPLSVTFHRAFDVTPDLSRSLEELISAGVERVLTSGGEQTARAGSARIAAMVQQAAGRITIMAGSGIDESNVRELLVSTGVREIHATLRMPVVEPRGSRLLKGVNTPGDKLVTSRERVAQLLAAARGEGHFPELI